MSEAWAAQHLYCLACTADRLDSARPGAPVWDYSCGRCGALYQLKSKGGAFSRKVSNSEYDAKIRAIEEGRAPHYAFLAYSPSALSVTDLFVVPGHLFSRALVERRRPLSDSAQRAGWVGSNILLDEISPDRRIYVVEAGAPRSIGSVRREWARFGFLAEDRRARGGWAADVLSYIRRMQRLTGADRFTLQEFYARFESDLAALHPDNHNVAAKIRQQLQVLRDGNVLEFLGRGRYRIIG